MGRKVEPAARSASGARTATTPASPKSPVAAASPAPPVPRGWQFLLLFSLAFVVHGGVIGDAYVFDGEVLLANNPALAAFDPARLATIDWWEGTGRPGGLYRPVSLLALAALSELGGGSPFLIDLASVAALGAAAMLQFALLARLLAGPPGAHAVAWLASAAALVHPLNAELVAGQVGLADLLAIGFACAAVLAGGSPSAERGPGVARLLVAAACAALAVLSKESGVLVLPLAILFEALRAESPHAGANGARTRRVLRAAAWAGAGVGGALVLRWLAIGSIAGVDDPVYAGFSALARAASACATFASYSLALVVAPWRQLAVVGPLDVPPAASFADPRAALGLLLFLLLALSPLVLVRRGRCQAAFGLWGFLAAVLPTSNLLVSTGALAASRFLAPGLFLLFLPATLLAAALWRRGGAARAPVLAAGAFFLGFMPVVAWREEAHWSDSRALLESQARRGAGSAYAEVDLATRIAAQEPARARELFRRAALRPEVHVPGTDVPPEDLLETLFLARVGASRLAEAAGDVAGALEDARAAAELAARGLAARATLGFREDWARQRLVALQRHAALELARARNLAGPEREAALTAADQALAACDACDASSAETVRLRSILLDRRGDPLGRARLVEQAWRARSEDPLLCILWANELRQSGRIVPALALELDVVLGHLDTFDAARALAIAKEALARSEPELAARGRKVLERLAAPDTRSALEDPSRVTTAREARALLAGTPPAGPDAGAPKDR